MESSIIGSGLACPSTASLINMLWGGLIVDGVSAGARRKRQGRTFRKRDYTQVQSFSHTLVVLFLKGLCHEDIAVSANSALKSLLSAFKHSQNAPVEHRHPKLTSENRCCVTEILQEFVWRLKRSLFRGQK